MVGERRVGSPPKVSGRPGWFTSCLFDFAVLASRRCNLTATHRPPHEAQEATGNPTVCCRLPDLL